MVHQSNTLNRRLERHHRIDGDLQARARPASLERKDQSASNAIVQKIRSLVEGSADDAQNIDRRQLLGFGGGSGTSRGTGDSPSSSSSSSSDDPISDPSSSSDGGDGNDSGDQETTTTANSGGRPGGFPQTTREDKTTRTTRASTSSTSSSSTSTSTTPTTTSTRTTSSSTRTTSSTLTSSSSASPSTSYAYVTSTPLPSLNAAAASSTPTETGSSGPSVGPIIGIVAGALAGVAILAVIIGFLIKKFSRKDDPYEADPFDRDSFRRQSAMLPDTFEDDDHMPEMSEAHNVGPFADHHDGYMADAAMMGGAGMGAAGGYAAAHSEGGPRPPTMFANHMNAPAAQMSMNDAPAMPAIGGIYTAGHDPSPQLPPMAFGGSDPYSIAGVGRQRMENNINNPYGYLDRQYSVSRSSPPTNEQTMHQDYADLDRNGSQGSNGFAPQQQQYQYDEHYSNYEHHNTAGRPGTAEGRSGTPDLPNVQQTYAMAGDDTAEMQRQERVMSPHRNVASPQHMSQDLISRSNSADPHSYRSAPSASPSPPSQPLQVRNLLPNPSSQQQRPISAVSSVVDDDAAYGGVW